MGYKIWPIYYELYWDPCLLRNSLQEARRSWITRIWTATVSRKLQNSVAIESPYRWWKSFRRIYMSDIIWLIIWTSRSYCQTYCINIIDDLSVYGIHRPWWYPVITHFVTIYISYRTNLRVLPRNLENRDKIDIFSDWTLIGGLNRWIGDWHLFRFEDWKLNSRF